MATILVAFSTYRFADRMVETAIARAEGRELLVLGVVDADLQRYVVPSEAGGLPGLEDQIREALLEEHRRLVAERLEQIDRRSAAAGLRMSGRIQEGDFAALVLEAVRRDAPELVVLTRSNRPAWMKRLFGSEVDRIQAACPVAILEV